MPDILGLDTFVIGRPDKFSLTISYGGYDKDGSKLFDVKTGILGGNYSLIDSSKNTIGTMHRKLISVTPFYELYDANKNLIGKALQELNVAAAMGAGGTMTYILEDPSGNKIAHVKVSSPLARMFNALNQGDGLTKSFAESAGNSAYNITSMDDATVIAKIGVVKAQTSGVTFGNNNANFVLEITDTSMSKLALIEFAIAVDHLYTSAMYGGGSRSSFGTGMGNTTGGFGGGGSGFSIKL